MTVKTQDESVQIRQNLNIRNQEVEKAYYQIVRSLRPLLSPFDSKKYRTIIEVNHSSGKESNLVSECICFFWNLTLSTNRAGYRMIYFTYDEESLARFGARLHNRAMRQVFRHTMFESTNLNIEDCVRINNPSNVQSFFINRFTSGENDFISIDVEEKLTV